MNTKPKNQSQLVRGLLHLTGAATVAFALPACVVGADDDDEPAASGSTGGDGGGSDTGGDGGGDTGADDGGGGPGTGGPDDPDGCTEVKEAALDILEANCAGCHANGQNQGGFGYILDEDQLLTQGKIVAGNAAESPLYQRIANGSMPPAPLDPVADQDLATIQEWINTCQGEVAEECDGNEVISFDEQIQYMLDDIATVDFDDREFTRYLTLSELYNAGVCDDKLEYYRAGISKAINALSWDPVITPPVPIDPNETILRIDIRDYAWDADNAFNPDGVDKWELFTEEISVYGVEFVQDEAQVLQQFTEDNIPFISGMAFLHDANLSNTPGDFGFDPDEAQIGGYHEMLALPANVFGQDGLEGLLNFNIQQNQDNFDVVRAGFFESDVSIQNRAFEMHQLGAAGQSLWLSFDFIGNGADENLFVSPLDFVADGGELIFNLPNGLQAYFVFNAAGERFNRAPIAVVQDITSETGEVLNGISCHRCHTEGIKFKKDEVRDFVLNSLDFDEDTKDIVSELYATEAELSANVDASAAAFKNAEARVWPNYQGPEPIAEGFKRQQRPVTAEILAGELGISKNVLLANLGKLGPEFSVLVNDNATVDRDLVSQNFAFIICTLNLGIADDAACDGVNNEEEVDESDSGTGG